MTQPNRPPIDIDDAEHIRKFSAQIRKTSGNPAFPSAPGPTLERPNITRGPVGRPPEGPASLSLPQDEGTHAPSAPVTTTPSPGDGTPSNADHEKDEDGQAVDSATTPSPADTDSTDLPPHPIFDYGNRLHQLPRAVQQLIGQSPQMSGLLAPHPTPESFKPSPMTELQHLEDPPTNEEIGLAIGQVLDSLPNAGKYGIEDSIWANGGPRSRATYPPRASVQDGQLIGLSAMPERKSEKEMAEARAREKEHNENFERMSFRIAESPWFGRKYTGNFGTQDKKPEPEQDPKDTPISERLSAKIMKENDRPQELNKRPTYLGPFASLDSEEVKWAPGHTTTKSIFTPKSSFTAKDRFDTPMSPSAVSTVSTAAYKYRSIGTQTNDEDVVKVVPPALPKPQTERRPSSDAWVNIDSPLTIAVDQSGLKVTASERAEPGKAKDELAAASNAQESSTLVKSSPKMTELVKKGPSASSILAAGLKFAKSRQSTYGAPSIEGSQTRESTELVPAPREAPELTPSSIKFTLTSPASVAAAAIAAGRIASREDAGDGDREGKVYFKAWGKPEGRIGGAAQKRKLTIYGNPAWDAAPTPTFVADLVFGGPLEQIHCKDHSADVTFLHTADAQNFFDATSNDILFRKDSSGASHYASVKWVDDVTPMSSLVQQHIASGVTRCIQAIGIPTFTIEALRAHAGGKMDRRGAPMRKVENVGTGVNARGHRVATFRFCDIRDAATFKAEKARDEDWETVNMQYITDPCAEAKGPRVKSSAAAI